MTTRLENSYTTWHRGPAAGKPFTADVLIKYPELTITYAPGFWQVNQMLSWTNFLFENIIIF